MDFLSDILGFAGNVASGGILGLVGSVIGGVAKYFSERQRQEFEKARWDYEAELQRLQMQARSEETEQEIRIVEARAAADQRVESYRLRMHAPGSVSGWVNDIRSLFRPVLTMTLLIGAGAVVTALSLGVISGYFDHAEVIGLVRYGVGSLVFAASTATVWWFGDRAMTPPGMKER